MNSNYNHQDQHVLDSDRFKQATDNVAKKVGAEELPSLEQKVDTPYKVIDSDPHFSRVVRFFRASDYRDILLGTVSYPILYYFWVRFWGWTENNREYNKDLAEMRLRVREGKPLYGKSNLENHYQLMAANNSRYSQLCLAFFPWFNFVNHPYHGTDTSRYYNQDDSNVHTNSQSPETMQG